MGTAHRRSTGTRWRTTMATRGRSFPMTVEVTCCDRPHRLGTTSTISTATVTGALTFRPHPAGTLMSWSWRVRTTGALRVLAPVVGPVGRRQERRTWSALKDVLEARPPGVVS